jgi:tetratricopeptide (TPR) repeat protein
MHLRISSLKTWSRWLGLSCVLLSFTALAQNPEGTAQAHIDSARRLFENLEYERALEELDRAQRRASTEEENLSILLHEGIVLSEMGRADEAFAAFQAALRLRPDAELPLKVSPKIQKLYAPMRELALRKSRQAGAGQGPAEAELEAPAELAPLPPSPPSEALDMTPAAPPQPVPSPSASVSQGPSEGRSLRQWAWAPAAAGGVAVGGGVLFLLSAESKYDALNGGEPLSLEEAQELRNAGRRRQTLARVSLGLGAALLLTGGAMALFGEPASPVEPQVAVGRDQVSLGLAGELPW